MSVSERGGVKGSDGASKDMNVGDVAQRDSAEDLLRVQSVLLLVRERRRAHIFAQHLLHEFTHHADELQVEFLLHVPRSASDVFGQL